MMRIKGGRGEGDLGERKQQKEEGEELLLYHFFHRYEKDRMEKLFRLKLKFPRCSSSYRRRRVNPRGIEEGGVGIVLHA